jgi:hypothetical protein
MSHQHPTIIIIIINIHSLNWIENPGIRDFRFAKCSTQEWVGSTLYKKLFFFPEPSHNFSLTNEPPQTHSGEWERNIWKQSTRVHSNATTASLGDNRDLIQSNDVYQVPGIGLGGRCSREDRHPLPS